MKAMTTSVLGLLLALPAFAQNDPDAAAGESAAAAEDFDRTPVKCVSVNRIRQTEIIDERTVLFRMSGNRIYRNELAVSCPRLVQEKRFSYDVHVNRLCDTDYITVLEYWGTQLREGPSCGLGMFYPITAEEAELLDADPDEMLDNARAVEESAESTGEPAPNE